MCPWVTSYRYCDNTMMIKIIIPTWHSKGIPKPQRPDKDPEGKKAVIGIENRGGCNEKKKRSLKRQGSIGQEAMAAVPGRLRRAYVKEKKPVALIF